MRFSRLAPLSLILAGCIPALSGSLHSGTSPEITPADVRARIFLVADDSMRGRQAGTEGNFKVTEYLAHEAAHMGLEPGGDAGTFFHTVPMVMRTPNPASSLVAGGDTLKLFRDYTPARPSSTARLGTRIDISGLAAVYGGRAGDTTIRLDTAAVAGRLIVFDPPLGSDGKPSPTVSTAAGTELYKYPKAAGIAIASLDFQPNPGGLQRPAAALGVAMSSAKHPGAILISSAAAEMLLGAVPSTLAVGTSGREITAAIGFLDSAVKAPARNVIAIKRGSDPLLRSEYVAMGAHNDHLGIANARVDHDSLRAFNRAMRPEGMQTRAAIPTAVQWKEILGIRDSLRKIRPPRIDSIYNGADDDGSGTVALLEIAESFAARRAPRRSVIFVWHTGEESGLLGSMYFTDHPTVPRESIVAQLNMDMVGRGRATDTPTGGPRNIQLIGARRLSTDLGHVIDSVNRARTVPWELDLSFDAPRHPQNRYCRSDHANYARYGIPIAYFSRGYHQDYHVVTDEAQYIDYDALSRVAGFVHDVAEAVANRANRPRVDKRIPNPLAPCRQ